MKRLLRNLAVFPRLLVLTSLLGILPMVLLALLLVLPTDVTLAEFRQLLGVVLMATPIAALCLAAIASESLSDTARTLLYAQRQFRAGNFDYRIPLKGDHGAVRLYRGFNLMAELAQAAFQRNMDAEKRKVLAEQALQVAHDIRSPLAALDAVLPALEGLAPREREAARAAVERMRAIADGLLAQHRGATPATAPRRLVELVAPVVQETRLGRRGAAVDFLTDWDASADAVGADVCGHELQRIVANLLNNAIEACDGKPGRVRVTVRADGDEAVIAVADDGKGIAPDVLPRLMQRGASFGKAEGNGLGLHHAQTVLARWGGSLAITSLPGDGTTVTARLPLVRLSVPIRDPAPVQPAAVTPSGEPPAAVLLDDEIWVREAWELEARRAQRPVLAVASGEALLRLAPSLRRETPIFIDSQLGDDVRGEEIARRLHELGFRNVYMATGFDAARFRGMPWIKGVVGKEPPAWLFREPARRAGQLAQD